MPPVESTGSPAMAELAGWLQQIGVPSRDALTCAQLLFADGCRFVDDVYMLAEADELPVDMPKVMRMKIMRACV